MPETLPLYRKWLPVVLVLTLGFALAGALAGCGSSSKSPAEVVEHALLAADRGDYEEVESYYSDSLADQMQSGMGLLFNGTDGFAEYYTRSGDLSRVEIISQEIDGDRARVEATLFYEGPVSDTDYFYFGSGEPVEQSVWELARESGGWKLIPNGIA